MSRISFTPIFFCLVMICSLGFSQTDELLLLKEAEKATGERKAILLNQLSEITLYNSAEKSLEYAQSAIVPARLANSAEQIATSYLNMANALRIMGNYNIAIDTLYKTMPFIEIINNKRLVVNILNVIGLCHQDLKHDTLSMESYVQSMGDQRLKKSASIADLTETLASLYFKTGNLSKSLEFYLKALRFYQISENGLKIAEMYYQIGNIHDINQNQGLALTYFNQATERFVQDNLKSNYLSLSYFRSGLIYLNKGDLKQAFNNFNYLLDQLKEVTDSILRIKAHIYIGRIYAESNQIEKAKSNFLTALEMSPNNSEEWVWANIEMGELFIKLKKCDLAMNSFVAASQCAQKGRMDEALITAWKGVAKVNGLNGNLLAANSFLRKIIHFNDSLSAKYKKDQLGEQEKQYLWESRETRIESLNKEKKIQRLQVEKQQVENHLLILTLVALILLILLLVRLYYLRTKTNRLLNIKSERILLRNTKLSTVNEELKTINEQLAFSEENLREANATKDKMFSIIAHDLRNPLVSLKSMIYILRSDKSAVQDGEMELYLQQLDRSLLGAIELMNNLLNWALSQQNSLKYTPQKFSLIELLNDNLAICKPVMEMKDIKVTISLEKNIPICTDKNMFDFVVRNFLSNAIKFTPMHGEVKIYAKFDDSLFQLEISDSGIGLSRNEIESLLTQNQMLSKQGTLNEKGSGLGLMVCKDFISKMNGNLLIESTPGKGSRFIIQLPSQ